MQPFEQVITEHGASILRVCRAIAGPDAAEDAWSETFLAALRAYPSLPPDSNIQAWLVTIARRKAIDQIRASARSPVALDGLREPAAHDPDPTEWDDLWTALKQLPTKQREAITYHHVAGLPYAEVAQILGNSETAARRAAADGMKTLRATYKGERR
jgi:RNA polymerase sigma factor (sigma-70 family)